MKSSTNLLWILSYIYKSGEMFKNNSLNHQKFHNNLHATVTMLSSQIYKPQLSNNDYLLVYCTTKASRYPWVWILSYRKKKWERKKKNTRHTTTHSNIDTGREENSIQYTIQYMLQEKSVYYLMVTTTGM